MSAERRGGSVEEAAARRHAGGMVERLLPTPADLRAKRDRIDVTDLLRDGPFLFCRPLAKVNLPRVGVCVNIEEYLNEVRAKFLSGQATELSYRSALEKLFNSIDRDLTVINEPKRVLVGAPDFVFNRGPVSIGWAEAKDVGKDLRFKTGDYSKEQKERYRKGLPNLIYTNAVDFEFYRDGERINAVSIADFIPGLPSRPDKFDELARNLQSFAQQQPISIRSAAKLASLMAGKAAIIKDVMGNLLKEDSEFRTPLGGQFKAFKADLLPNLDTDEFADIYAETITYGMFAARLHDTSLDSFSRAEALTLLPKSNPFLRSLFGYIAGAELDDRIAWIIDDLAAILRASDPFLLFKDFGKFTARNDPFVHFYEDFLKEYNPAKRKSRGVWYTPEPVVDFIVRAVDDVLKTEFGLADGLADTSKVTVDWDTGQTNPKTGRPVTIKKDVHRVQILDPATGTGTFLAKAVQTIAGRVKARAPGKWSGYVEKELIPRLHGFELLMASYTMCHMKLEMMLHETGYVPSEKPARLSVWLTNSLEPSEREVRDLFFTALADEARGASEVKRNKPIMCVIGNPPYSGISQNMGEWIVNLIEDYKYIDGEHFGEVKHWLQDDYVKFIRTSQRYIDVNGEGILGFITNHGFLANPTFRAMRWNLLQTFDQVYVLDLHGNSNRRERCPDGSDDSNVFDIKQGVSIFVGVKRRQSERSSKKQCGEVFHADAWGKRKSKEELLFTSGLDTCAWTKLDLFAPYYFFVPFDAKHADSYDKGFSLGDFFSTRSKGVITARDNLAVGFCATDLKSKIARFVDPSRDDLAVRTEFFGKTKDGKYLPGDTRSWDLPKARKAMLVADLDTHFAAMSYRPFDFRTYYNGLGLTDWPRDEVMGMVIGRDNLGLSFNRRIEYDRPFSDALVMDVAIQHHSLSIKEANDFGPLYTFTEASRQGDVFKTTSRALNFDPKIYAAICKAANLTPLPDAGDGDAFRTATGDERATEVKVFDYIYGVLHSPAYRETYAEFLKIDFPRIPYPRDPETFAHVSVKGEALRRLHLMEAAAIGDTPYPYHGDGDDVVAAGYPKFEKGGVTINADQHFDAVPALSWNFHIGGYQPAQKWLKDRRGRTLSFDDIGHYQKIVKILTETDRIMREIKLPLDS